jgi:6-pyruvoyltetrahydropterin/6-carboxytetrahydropterin synthase
MYTLTLRRAFVAQHYLIGGDWGPENDLHSHHYRLEITLEGYELDQHGYLVDIVHLEALLDDLVDRYRDHTLNELPEFQGLNPSIEHFSRIVAQRLSDALHAPNICAVTALIWENDIASASYRHERPCK